MKLLRRGALAAVLVLAAGTARAADPDPWLGADKPKHFVATLSLSVVGYSGASVVTPSRTWRLITGGALAMGAGIAKELWDLAGHGTPSWKDLAWDGLGTAVGLVVTYLVDRFLLTAVWTAEPMAR